MSVAGRLVVIAGATSASGLAAARELRDAGARVVAVGRDAGKLREFAEALESDAAPLAVGSSGSVRTEVCDLGDEGEVIALAERVHAAEGAVDGVLHLVGGWRGGGGLAGQSDDDYRFLEGALTALRHVSRAFDADLRASDSARTAIVSSVAVERPLAGGANYAAVKAASEAWARAVAQGFAKDARDAGKPLAAASVIFRTKSLSGLEDALAQRFADLWMTDATELNDTIVALTDPSL
ncbi:SDR family oxidoreductase [Microbacterium sp. M3]|uniref:SDR family oxidoreductase n=1 Tax=Microbacterium arthrosphaerae TaxID=792652 RepID=A0ABU4H7F8_9MICO|nr:MULTISPECIES: SDR family oxidoreductase [Microbacterium]MDW4573814.1 SDR family oxidoreductase [Microbacterium arthrosphaerae]MDW7607669.1 SDR family oxidoreductase [Microbacterium sp. M3]